MLLQSLHFSTELIDQLTQMLKIDNTQCNVSAVTPVIQGLAVRDAST